MNAGEKLTALREIIGKMESAVAAFSGGADSSFLVRTASEILKDRLLAATAVSPTYTGSELEDAKSFALAEKIPHTVIETKEAEDERYVSNPPDRCYYCKRELFSRLETLRKDLGFRWIIDGTNADDSGDYRPGMRAAAEFGVRSPLAEAGLAKDEIRTLSREMGLATSDKPAQPCLASRIPYGTRVTGERLAMVERAEAALEELGFPVCRVRHHGAVARIEVPSGDISRLFEENRRGIILEKLKETGFTYVSVDIVGYRTGSMNEVIGK